MADPAPDQQFPLPLNPAALQEALTQLQPAKTGQMQKPRQSPAAQAPPPPPPQVSAPLSSTGGTIIDPSQVQNQQPPAMPQQPPPDVNLGSAQTQPQKSGPPKQSIVPTLGSFIADMIKGPGYEQGAPGQPGRPISRLDSFENFIGTFLNSFSQGMSNAGTGPAANARGFGAAVQAPYQRQLQQYQLGQQQQTQQAGLAETQARTQGMQIENEINQRRLAMMGQALATGQDPVASLGKLSSDEQAQVNAAKTESSMKGDMTPMLQVVDKITNNRALAQRQQVGINAANTRASQALGEKMREFKITDDYRKWKENLDILTKNRIADLAQNKAPAAMQESAVFAKSGLNRLSDAQQAMDELKASGVMGTLPTNKVEDWIFGKGLVDPSLDAKTRQTIGKMRSALSYTSTAAMRSHTGRTSQEIFDDFKNTLGPGQDWDALMGAMDETRSMLTEYANAPSDANIRAMRAGQSLAGGGANAPAPNTKYSSNNPFAPKK